jgi:hypothetical protein
LIRVRRCEIGDAGQRSRPDGSKEATVPDRAFGHVPAVVASTIQKEKMGQDRLEVEQQRYLSRMGLRLLVDIIPSAAGNLVLGIRPVLHVMAIFVVISGTTVASAIIRDEILAFVAVMGGFLRDLGRWSDEYEVCSGPPLNKSR